MIEKCLWNMTPRDLAKPWIIPKDNEASPIPDNLPVDTSKLHIAGRGDWNGSRTELGSAVFDNGKVVVKIPLGRSSRDYDKWARQQKKVAELYDQNISPKTMVVIADNGDGPVPIIIQKKIDGRPICDKPIDELLTTPKIWRGLKEVLINSKKVLISENCLDLSGLRPINSIVSKLLKIIPILSDNIMVDRYNNVQFVDNTPDICHRIKRVRQNILLIDAQIFCCDVMETTSRVIRKIVKTKNSPIAEGAFELQR